RSREQHARGAHPPPAQEALSRADPHRARGRLPGGQGLMRSIRRRILLLVLGLLSLSLSLISYKSYSDARHEIEELFDAELAQHARLLAGMVDREIRDDLRAALQASLDEAVASGSHGSTPGHAYEKKLAFVVIDDQ